MKNLAQYSDMTFGNQRIIPRLPVPGLEETCGKFLEWVKPLLTSEDLERTSEETAFFCSEEGPGPLLQEALVEFASRKDVANWLEPFWDRMYLEGRSPLPLYSNIFYMMSLGTLAGEETQFNRAAGLVEAMIRFKELIESQSLRPDMQGDRPICMIQYKKVFSSCRIPQKDRDILRTPISGENPASPDQRHIVVARNGRFFALDVIDNDGRPYSSHSIEKALAEIVSFESPPEYPPGVLTAVSRDTWAEARAVLRALSPINAGSLDLIENSLFILCLESRQPKDMKDLSMTMLLGDGRSRWFDKSMQLIVCPGGEAAINMEHTGTDGSVMVRLAGFLTGFESDLREKVPESSKGECSWREIQFHLNNDLREFISRADEECQRMSADTAARVLLFDRFGRDSIKALSAAPDAFIQMALQLAHFDLRGFPANTYEAVMTRQFLHGRTEAVRSVSEESVEFTRLMRGPEVSLEQKATAARKAMEEHVRRTREARDGRGVDRHLFGLWNIYRDMGSDLGIVETPGFFETPGWFTLRRNLLSTSTSGAKGLFLAGFGTVEDEGFAVRYLAFPGSIHFNVTSRTAMMEDMERFVDLLESALLEMEELLSHRSFDQPPSA